MFLPPPFGWFAPPEPGDRPNATYWLMAAVLGVLIFAYLAGRALQRRSSTQFNPAVIRRFNLRIRFWWLMFSIIVASFLLGRTAAVILFGVVSFWSLREYIAMTLTRRGDHRALIWTFFLLLPGHYLLIVLGRGGYKWLTGSEGDFYSVYSVALPLACMLLIPTRIAISGDPRRFWERAVKIQMGIMICVYALGFAPALLNLRLTHSDGQPWSLSGSPLENATLLFYFLLLVQLNDVLQYAWGGWLGRRLVAPRISASRTWEGLLGGVASTTLVGALLCKFTPFRLLEAACMASAVAVAGWAGGMVMSAVKRDRGIDDYGSLVQGHAGILDRIDSLCFAAPVFYILTRSFFSE